MKFIIKALPDYAIAGKVVFSAVGPDENCKVTVLPSGEVVVEELRWDEAQGDWVNGEIITGATARWFAIAQGLIEEVK